MMRTYRCFEYSKIIYILLLAIVMSACSSATADQPHSSMTQVSLYPALQAGMYDGDMTYAQLEKAGNFGIGTFDGMDGEMVALDGQFYQVKSDGSVNVAEKVMEAPFAMVHYFRVDQQSVLKDPAQSYEQLKTMLDGLLLSTDRPYAIKISGVFPYLKLRSVPKQSEPFQPLDSVIAQQTVFEFQEMRGTLVGYWMPAYLANINVPGYHLHFISEDKQHGGHVLDCKTNQVNVEIDDLDNVKMVFPETSAFEGIKLSTGQK